MADIITRLVMKSDAFDANLKRAKGSVNSFQNDISNMAKTAGAGVLKFAGTLGIAVGAGETFMKTIRATQGTSDEFDNNLNACKDSVNSFFEALSSGDFSYFENGLINVFQKAKDLSATLDTLGDIAIGFDIKGGKLNNIIQKNLNTIRDKESSKEEIKRAKEENKRLLAEHKKYSDQKVEMSKKALVKMYEAKAGINGATIGDVEVYLTGGNAHMYDNAIAKYKRDLDGLDKKLKNVIHENGTAKEKSDKIASIRQEIAAYKEKNAVIGKLAKAMNNITDTERDELVKLMKDMDAARYSYQMLEAKVIRGNNAEGSAGGTTRKPPKDENPLKGALAWYDTEISRLNKKLSKETAMQARATIQAEINELEQQKINLKFVIDREAFKIKHGEMKGGDIGYIEQYNMLGEMLSEREYALSKATNEGAKVFIQSQIEKLQETIEELNKAYHKIENTPVGDVYGALRDNAGNKKQGSFDLRKEIGGMKLPKFESPIKKKDIDLNKLYAESLGSIANSFGSMTSMSEQFGNEGVSFMFNAMGSISQMIVQLQSLATAQGIASAFALPFPASLGAVATVIATVTSIFASIPKFAKGGIVPGISFAGDKVPAMLNSGEMILNGSQQANLFKILNSKLYAGLDVGRPNITPSVGHLARLIAPSENKVQVEFGKAKVIGTDIFLSINNTLKKQGKKPL